MHGIFARIAAGAALIFSASAVAMAGDREPENYNTTLTFSEFPDHTVIVDDYDTYGIHFYGADKESPPFITDDANNPTSPVLSGTPQFEGDIKGRFVSPGTGKQVLVDKFALDAGFFNSVGSTELFWFDKDGNNLGSMKNTNGNGIQRFVVTGKGIARWTIRRVHDDLSGFAIDNVSFDAPQGACPGSRGDFIESYQKEKIDLHPLCKDPTKHTRTAIYGFVELNSGNTGWALLRAPLVAPASAGFGVDAWVGFIKSHRKITQGFTDPLVNASQGGSRSNRHIFGDAVDLQNRSQTVAEYDELAAAATMAQADFIEKNNENSHCHLQCVHADWRFHSGGFVSQ